MSATPDMRPPSHWKEIVAVVCTIGGVGYAVIDKVYSVGGKAAAVEAAVAKVEKFEAVQSQQTVDMVRMKMQIDMGTASTLRVEDKVDKTDTKVDHVTEKLNDVLTQIRITNGRSR